MKLSKGCTALVLLLLASAAEAGVPMDSFNAINAGLAPSLAIQRNDAGTTADGRGGPQGALLEMARRQLSKPAAGSPAGASVAPPAPGGQGAQ